MNKSQIFSEFRTIFELNSSGLPGLLDTEIETFFDNAQYKFISQRLEGNNVYKTTYPQTQKRIDDLNGLIVVEDVVGSFPATWAINYYTVSMEDFTYDYLHLIGGSMLTSRGRYNLRHVPFQNVSKFEYSTENPVYIENPVYTVLNNGSYKLIRVYFDKTEYIELGSAPWTYSKTEVHYLKHPTLIKDVASDETPITDFAEDTYREILKIAVDEAIASFVPQKVQVSQGQLNKIE